MIIGNGCKTTDHIPIFLALYDVLNDDDDEVRDMGAEAVKHILGSSIVPIEAASRFLGWIAESFPSDPNLKEIACGRIIGEIGSSDWKQASARLEASLQFDDALFVIEEQNLFIDEVRETWRWARLFEQLSWSENDESLKQLNEWTSQGLDCLYRQFQKEDGPLGWASSPDVFALCTYIIGAAVALTNARQASQDLASAMVKAQDVLKTKESHVSRLLVDALDGVKTA